MVEMTETANILHNASRHSLVLMDEIGRGDVNLRWFIARMGFCAEALNDIGGNDALCHSLFRINQPCRPAASKPVIVTLIATETNDQVAFLYHLKAGAAES